MKKLHPSPQKKVTTSFSATPLSKLRSCQAYPFSKIWWEAQPHRPSPLIPPHTMETEETDLLEKTKFEISVSFALAWSYPSSNTQSGGFSF